ncbi:solute carrier family 66 member 2-like isoform X2 [Diadema setosum]|uniref:solute carrier family 66 member 2-like isoform X2 n=1 Tax=Diadema setosum TaxID=31175 RepID=UPI003B3BD18F
MENDIVRGFANLADHRMPDITLINLVSWGASAAMIFGGIVPFIPQYMDIRRSENTDGFSTYVCLVLLIANSLRILFWFGHPFELPLLAQSIIMIGTMMVMLQLCTRVKALHELSPVKKHFTDFNWRHFWKWTRFIDYILFMVMFSTIGGVVTFLLSSSNVYVETIGFLAVFTEAMLGSPQFYHNYKNKSTQGMSIKMVMFWLSGDLFKTGYFLVNSAPVQFWICGILQVSIDIAILSQVVYYGTRPPVKLAKVSAPADHIS